jgi:hypothetical protein
LLVLAVQQFARDARQCRHLAGLVFREPHLLVFSDRLSCRQVLRHLEMVA